jgi:hypothetical protein
VRARGNVSEHARVDRLAQCICETGAGKRIDRIEKITRLATLIQLLIIFTFSHDLPKLLRNNSIGIQRGKNLKRLFDFVEIEKLFKLIVAKSSRRLFSTLFNSMSFNPTGDLAAYSLYA